MATDTRAIAVPWVQRCRHQAVLTAMQAPRHDGLRPRSGPPLRPTRAPRFVDKRRTRFPLGRAAAQWALGLHLLVSPAYSAPDQNTPDNSPRNAPTQSSAPIDRSEPRPETKLADYQEIDTLVLEAIGRRETPGAVVVVGTSQGIVFERAYGARSILPKRQPMRLDTIFDLASVTKPVVTATLIQMLVDQGRLQVQHKASQYLPAFNGFGKEAVTVQQLLLHTSGLPPANSLRDYRRGREAAVQRIFQGYLQEPAGTQFLYSDVGYIVLGELLEQVAQQPLDQLAQQALFEPLRMSDTSYRPPDSALERIAPTSISPKRKPRLIHGQVHDPRAYRMGGVAGHAGLFSTGRDLARYARFLLNGGVLDGKRVMSPFGVEQLLRPHRLPADQVRSLGFDVRSKYSKARSALWSPSAVGHGGYTGSCLWLDPQQDRFVIFLSNRVHPYGRGKVLHLQNQVATAALRALPSSTAACASSPSAVLPGVDVAARDDFEPLRGKRVGLLTHRAATNRAGETTLSVLLRHPQVNLVALFSPEHGLAATSEGAIAHSVDPLSGLPVHSLYGKTKRPTDAMLDGLEVLAVDLVDVGVRFYTYLATLHEVMRAAAARNLPVVIFDRPNPLGGLRVAGPVLDSQYKDFVNHHPLPVVHGMTAGELAELLNDDDELGVRLHIVQAEGWTRSMQHRDTQLPWHNPSPNLRSADAALLYPAVGLLESTNIAVGRGTQTPFEHFGAPFIDANALLSVVEANSPPGVSATTTSFTPLAGPHRGRLCHGLAFKLTDRAKFRPVRLGITLAAALQQLHPRDWDSSRLGSMLGDRRAVQAIEQGQSPRSIEDLWQRELGEFRRKRQVFLRYPACRTRPH